MLSDGTRTHHARVYTSRGYATPGATERTSVPHEAAAWVIEGDRLYTRQIYQETRQLSHSY